MLPPEPLEQVTAHFVISDADSISTQRNGMWYYMLYGKDYKIGRTYRLYWIYWSNGEKTWDYQCDDMKVTEKIDITVEAGTFLCYHFQRQNPRTDWSPCMSDEYVMVKSKALVYAADPYIGTIELTEYRPGWD